MKADTFIHDSIVTKKLRKSSTDPNHYYNLHLKHVRMHSVRVIACLILVVAKLSDATIEHRLRWEWSACKVYVHEILFHVSQASISSFYRSLGTQAKNNDAAYTPQAYDVGNIL